MRLLDQVMQHRSPVVVELPGRGVYHLPGAGVRARALEACPLRYVLADDVRGLCDRIIGCWPDLLDPADPSLRMPSQDIWMEWSEPAAAIVIGGKPQARGLLLEVDDTGRRGRIESFWEDRQYGVDRAQICIEFDFDQPLTSRIDGRHSFSLSLGRSLDMLAPHVMCSVGHGWRDYFNATSAGPAGIDGIIRDCAKGIRRDLPMMLAFSRLLASRPEIDMRPVERSPLNAVRAKSGKPALLDHLELSLKLGGEGHADRPGTVQGHRHDPRLHIVRGHMVNRRGVLYWRSSHLRGRADLLPLMPRNIAVSMDRRAGVGGR